MRPPSDARLPDMTSDWESFLYEVRAAFAGCGATCDTQRLCAKCQHALGWYRRLACANVPRKYWPHEIENAIVADPDAVAFIQHAIDEIADVIGAGLGLATFGKNGNGKTTLCLYVVKAALRAGFSAYYAHVEGLLSLIKDSFDEPHLRERIRAIRSVDVLLLDDLGRENEGRTGWVAATFDELFRYRDGMGLSTLMTTNLQPSTCRERYGSALASLWSGSAKEVIVHGEDLRPRLNRWGEI